MVQGLEVNCWFLIQTINQTIQQVQTQLLNFILFFLTLGSWISRRQSTIPPKKNILWSHIIYLHYLLFYQLSSLLILLKYFTTFFNTTSSGIMFWSSDKPFKIPNHQHRKQPIPKLCCAETQRKWYTKTFNPVLKFPN